MTRVPLSLGRRSRSIRTPKIVAGMEHIAFLALLKQEGLPIPRPEYRFAAPRRWCFDYAWPGGLAMTWLVALEVEGGAFSRGRHTRGTGFIADMEKYNEAAVRGWIVIRVTPDQLCASRTIDWVRRALAFC